MILEMRTTRYRPGAADKVNEAYAAALPEREKISPLLGMFHVETGPLDTTIELWAYGSERERSIVLERAGALVSWPPALESLRVREQTEVLQAASPDLPPASGAYGKIYEFRIYQVRAGKMQEALDRWAEKIDARRTMSPYLGLYYNDGPPRTFVHIWAYDDAAHRMRVREQVRALGLWPPPLVADGLLEAMDTVLTTPAPFSRLS